MYVQVETRRENDSDCKTKSIVIINVLSSRSRENYNRLNLCTNPWSNGYFSGAILIRAAFSCSSFFLFKVLHLLFLSLRYRIGADFTNVYHSYAF